MFFQHAFSTLIEFDSYNNNIQIITLVLDGYVNYALLYSDRFSEVAL